MQQTIKPHVSGDRPNAQERVRVLYAALAEMHRRNPNNGHIWDAFVRIEVCAHFDRVTWDIMHETYCDLLDARWFSDDPLFMAAMAAFALDILADLPTPFVPEYGENAIGEDEDMNADARDYREWGDDE